MFHLLAYNGALAAAAANTQLSAVADSEFSRRGTTPSFVLSEEFALLWAAYLAASATDVRLDVPTLNAIFRHHVYPFNRSATVPSNPNVADMRDYPLTLPTYEELQVQGSNDLGSSTEQSQLFMAIAPTTFNKNLPRGERRMVARATGAVAGVAQSWSSPGNVTFDENLRNGWYSIVGTQLFDAGTLAFRWIFSKPMMHQGRKLRPGGLAMEAVANVPWVPQMGGLGEWGRFHSQEPPQLEIFANASAASAQILRVDMVYLGSGNP